MPATPNKVSLAKALILSMLVVLSTIEMATTIRLPEDAQVSDTLHVDHTSLAIEQKRYLRSVADVTSTDRSSSVVKRRLIPDFLGLKDLSARLGENMSATVSSFRRNALFTYFQFIRKDSNDMFQYLQLDKKKDKLFDSPEVFTWIAFVKETTRSDAEAIKQMSKTLNELVKPKHNLIEALDGMNKNHELYETVQKIRRQYISTQHTLDEVCTFLDLDKLSFNELLFGPELRLLGTWMDITGNVEYVNIFWWLAEHNNRPTILQLLNLRESKDMNALNREIIDKMLEQA